MLLQRGSLFGRPGNARNWRHIQHPQTEKVISKVPHGISITAGAAFFHNAVRQRQLRQAATARERISSDGLDPLGQLNRFRSLL